MKITTVLLTIAAILAIFPSKSVQHTVYRDPGKYCGSKFIEILELICRGTYNGPARKRNGLRFLQLWKPEIRFPFISRKRSQTVFTSEAPVSRDNPESECCEKSCSFSELEFYCAATTTTPRNL
ncbi:LIRP-like [Rhynchophorus ferrugineus]|uniref:LIRP-like n=1 Tax=Rhynchophorus ferrugineus TaxID=354439 RepID=UPI003FCD447E